MCVNVCKLCACAYEYANMSVHPCDVHVCMSTQKYAWVWLNVCMHMRVGVGVGNRPHRYHTRPHLLPSENPGGGGRRQLLGSP